MGNASDLDTLEARSEREQRVDRWIIGVSTVIFGTATFLLFNDSWLIQNYLQGRGRLKTFGQMSYSFNDVRRKISDDFLWLAIKKSDEVYEGDSIFTSNDSEAEIQLSENQPTVWMEENTLIVFKRLEGSPALEIKQGKLQGKLARNQQLQIISRQGALSLKGPNSDTPAQVELSAQESGDVQLKVISGETEAKSGENTQVLRLNQEAELSSAGKGMKVRTYPIALLNPRENDTVKKDQTEIVYFSWEGPPGVSQYRIQVSFESDFLHPVLNQSVAMKDCDPRSAPVQGTKQAPVIGGKLCTISTKLQGVGMAFWRVTGEKPADRPNVPITLLDSGISRFRLFYDSAPSPRVPAFGAILELGDAAKPIRFQWNDQSGARSFRFQLARDKDFQNRVHESVTQVSRTEIPALPDGTYYWRVRVDEATQSAPWGITSTFSVQKQALPNPPELVGPIDQHKFVRTKNATRLDFRWNPRPEAASYIFEVADTPEFEPLVFLEEVLKPSFSWEPPSNGNYYWRVRAVTKSGQATVYSASRGFRVETQ